MILDVSDRDVACTGVAGHCGTHETDGASTRDENILAHKRELEGCVHGIAERIKDRS